MNDSTHVILIRTCHGGYDATSITHSWGDDVVSQAQQTGISVTEFSVDSPGRDGGARAFLRSRRKFADLIAFFGHGAADALLLPANHWNGRQSLVDLTNARELLHHKHVWATSCLSASRLGPFAVGNGTQVYTGYRDLFCFVIPHSEVFRRCANAWVEPVLGDSKTWQTGLQCVLCAYEEEFAFCQGPDGPMEYGLDLMLVEAFLLRDMEGLHALGEVASAFQ